jgi:hypothetical protein
MAKLIKVWDGSAWQSVSPAFPYEYITINGSQVNLGGSVTIPTGPTSQSVSSNITMQSNYKYFVDTTAARTLTLPSSPTVGNTIEVFDASGTAATYNITVARNSQKINGISDDALLDVNGAAAVFTYTGSTYGWRMG